MKISWSNFCLWHVDCKNNKWKSGVIEELKHDDKAKHTLVKCLHCNDSCYVPYGFSGTQELETLI